MYSEVFNQVFVSRKFVSAYCIHFFVRFRHSCPTRRTLPLISDTPDKVFLIVDIRYNGWGEVRTKVMVARVENKMNDSWGMKIWMLVTTRRLPLHPPTPLTFCFAFHCIFENSCHQIKNFWIQQNVLSSFRNTSHGCSDLEKSCYIRNLSAWHFTNYSISVSLQNMSTLVELSSIKILTTFLETPILWKCLMNANDVISTLILCAGSFLLPLWFGTTPRGVFPSLFWTLT